MKHKLFRENSMEKDWTNNNAVRVSKRKKENMFKPATFRVLGGRHNHYTTETAI